MQNSKCRFSCRLQRNASFISLLNWTELGPKLWGEQLVRCWQLLSEGKKTSGHELGTNTIDSARALAAHYPTSTTPRHIVNY